MRFGSMNISFIFLISLAVSVTGQDYWTGPSYVDIQFLCRKSILHVEEDHVELLYTL